MLAVFHLEQRTHGMCIPVIYIYVFLNLCISVFSYSSLCYFIISRTTWFC